MEKTYCQKVHYRIVIEGDYSCANLYEEELWAQAEEAHDCVLGHLGENICDYLSTAKIELTNLRTKEE